MMNVLVIGHGESFRNYDFIREFNGELLSVDASTGDLIRNGIIPDYHLYSETQKNVKHYHEKLMPEECFKKPEVWNKITVIYRHNVTPTLLSKMGRYKLRGEVFDAVTSTNSKFPTQAVGLYSIAYADLILKPTEIHLIGFDYKGLDNDGVDMTVEWIKATKYYLDLRSSHIPIIDHSGGAFPL